MKKELSIVIDRKVALYLIHCIAHAKRSLSHIPDCILNAPFENRYGLKNEDGSLPKITIKATTDYIFKHLESIEGYLKMGLHEKK